MVGMVCGDGNYEWCQRRGGGVSLSLQKKKKKVIWRRHDITLTQQDWMTCQRASRWIFKKKEAQFQNILSFHSQDIKPHFCFNWNIKSREWFPQRSPCLFLITPTWKAEPQHLFTVSVTHFGPRSGPPTPNNIHYFLTLKKEHPLWSILDVGGQIFGLKTCSSRLICSH